MAIIFMDGFDHYFAMDGVSGRKWDVGSTGGMWPGRFGGQSCYVGAYNNASATTSKTFTQHPSTIVLGCAMMCGRYGFKTDKNWLQFLGNNKTLLEFSCDENGSIVVKSNNIPVATLSFTMPLGLWFYFEVKLTVGPLATCVIHIDSVEKLNTTFSMTNGTVGYVDKMTWRNPWDWPYWTDLYIDDLYVVDTSGTYNNDFLGEVRIQTKYPDAEGSQTDFRPSQGTNNSLMVNATSSNFQESGKFNYSGTPGDIDLYSIGNFTVSGQIFAVQENIIFRKDDVGNRSVAPLLKYPDGSMYEGPDLPCYSGYTWGAKVWERDPVTANMWLLTDLNQTEFGLKVKS